MSIYLCRHNHFVRFFRLSLVGPLKKINNSFEETKIGPHFVKLGLCCPFFFNRHMIIDRVILRNKE